MSDCFKSRVLEETKLIENIISKKLPSEVGFEKKVLSAMNYSINAGGKRLRPMLILESYRLFTGAEDIPEIVANFMVAIECIHTYSLVHDDLPAMDNDEYRRGNLTTWKVYGDGMGVLAGDALLNYAFEIMLREANGADLSNQMKAMRILADKAGINGMIGGQCADLEAEGRAEKLSAEELLYIHEHKTACLIEAALMVGGALAGASCDDIKNLEKIGSNIGIAFQIQDDILDVEGDSAILGKTVGSDEANEKSTYVSLYGISKAKEDVQSLSIEAEKMLGQLPGNNEFLSKLIMSLVGRSK